MPLDIESVAATDIVEEGPPNQRLPDFIRAWGLLPIESNLWPGDIMLMSPRRPSWQQRQIIGVQKRAFNLPEAGYTHAAIYLGDFQICEALATGVKVSPLLEYFEHYKILPLRSREITERDGFRIAIRALQRLRHRYGFGNIFEIVTHVVSGLHREKPGRVPALFGGRSTICSRLCADAIAEALGGAPLIRQQVGVPLPADLAASSRLEEIKVTWRRLPKETERLP